MSTNHDNMPEIVISCLYGECPVQAKGTINGKKFYFRARYDSWSLRIGGDDIVVNPEWRYDEAYGPPGGFDAGWMDEDEARAFIVKAAKLYARQS